LLCPRIPGDGTANGRNILDAANINGQWGRADYDVNKRLALDAVWEVPVPFQSGILKNTLGGWRLSTIAILQSGLPFSVYSSASYPSGDYNADGFNYDPPNTPTFGNYLSASRGAFISGIFKTADFSLPASGTPGSLGRNTFDGPGLANINLNAVKNTHIPWFLAEGATLQLRGEIFNLFNRVNLVNPVSDLSNSLFGRSTGQNLPRTVTFGVRIQF